MLRNCPEIKPVLPSKKCQVLLSNKLANGYSLQLFAVGLFTYF